MNNLILTPAAINKYLKSIVEGDKYLKNFEIGGEISNFKQHSSGNFYFSLKDSEATIDCVMFSSYAKKVTVDVTDGMNVELVVSIYLNVKSGKYSLNVRELRLAGVGDLHKLYLQLKVKLEQKGYFNKENKKNINTYPKKIGVITSPTSAAVRDILTTIKRRYPLCEVVVIPTLVQGSKAIEDICTNISRANELGDFDTLIVGRGGGSIEDLWAFNSEEVAHATYNSKIPIISCVGHETDTTIIDYVADLRAPTPTAAAELATSDVNVLEKNINSMINNCAKILTSKVEFKKLQLQNISNSQYFLNPLLTYQVNLDNLETKLKFKAMEFRQNLNENSSNLTAIRFKLEHSINNKIEIEKKSISHKHNLLDSLNPLAVLSRGYSVATLEGKSIKSISQVKQEDIITLRLSDGTLKSKVIKESDGI